MRLIGVFLISWLLLGVLVNARIESIRSFSFPVLTPKEGTYGPESLGTYWMKDSQVVFEAYNPLSSPIQLVSRVVWASNPCGDYPVFQSITDSFKGSIQVDEKARSFVLRTRLESNEIKEVRVKFSAVKCKIETDPRVFLGSIQAISSTWTDDN